MLTFFPHFVEVNVCSSICLTFLKSSYGTIGEILFLIVLGKYDGDIEKGIRKCFATKSMKNVSKMADR